MQTGTTRRDDRSRLARRPLETYFGDIDVTPLLSAEEERALAYRIQEGDPQARDHLVRANLRLVVNIARGYVGKGMDLQDLIAEGNLGLLRAAEGFDPAMNTRFSTYACYWIKQSIRRGLISSGRDVRLPVYANTLLTKWHRTTAELQEELGRPPTPEEVGQRLRLSRRKLKIVKHALRICNAVPQGDQGAEGPTVAESLADDRAAPPEEEVMHSDELRQVLSLLDQMDERSRAVLRLRFGLDGDAPMTLQEIGTALGLTRERVRQIERDALARLRDLMGGD
jgi:RNA polymerase primary sigma factor